MRNASLLTNPLNGSKGKERSRAKQSEERRERKRERWTKPLSGEESRKTQAPSPRLSRVSTARNFAAACLRHCEAAEASGSRLAALSQTRRFPLCSEPLGRGKFGL